jgi:phospholipase A-2-activating protein
MATNSISGHHDVVRGIANVPGVGFLSCANDGMIYLWSYTGEVLHSYIGHSDYVYTIAVINDELFASCGEDATLKIWSFSMLRVVCITIHG